LDFTCVDIAKTEEGMFVFEVSAFGGFRGLKEAFGIDAAGLYLDHVMKELGKNE
jgi:ribosomal protein S6--L-glutamate ligase